MVTSNKQWMRRGHNKAVHAVMQLGEDLRQSFVEKNQHIAMSRLSEAIDRGDPWVLSAWLEAAGAIRNNSLETAMAKFLLERFGTADQKEVAELADSGREMLRLKADASMSREKFFDDGLELLKAVIVSLPDSEQGEWRKRAVEALGGTIG